MLLVAIMLLVVPINVGIVYVGKMSFQGAAIFAFELALSARKSFNVDTVFVCKMLF